MLVLVVTSSRENWPNVLGTNLSSLLFRRKLWWLSTEVGMILIMFFWDGLHIKVEVGCQCKLVSTMMNRCGTQISTGLVVSQDQEEYVHALFMQYTAVERTGMKSVLYYYMGNIQNHGKLKVPLPSLNREHYCIL